MENGRGSSRTASGNTQTEREVQARVPISVILSEADPIQPGDIKMIRKRAVLTLLLMAVLFAVGAAAQTPAQDLVYVTVTVTGPKKAPAPGLKAENFQLW